MIIKTPRSRVSALIDSVLTALAWLAFIYLCASGIIAILLDSPAGISVPVIRQLLPSMDTLLTYAVVALFNAFILIAWAAYNALRFRGMDRRRKPLPLSDEALSASFHVDAAQLDLLHDSRVIVIHHDPDGAISAVQGRRA